MSLKRSGTQQATTKSAGVTTRGVGNAAAPINPLDPSQLDVNVIGWHNLEQKFQELRGLLSAPAAGLNAHQARAQQKQNVSAAIVQLLDRAQQDCRRLLIEGNAKAAVEGGLKTLHIKELYYGHGHLQLVPAYFHLARTNQYMDKFKAAEEFLSLAQWTILRNKDVDVSLKAELHQTFGLLYASDAKLDAALKQLTSATYYLCVMNGPEHILTSFGYFDLGNVFAAKSNMEHAMAFYDKVKDIWYAHLTAALRHALEPEQQQAASEGDQTYSNAATDVLVAANFGIENLQDAVKMLRGIVGLQTERYGRVHPSTARAEYVLGMFMLWNGDAASAMGSLLKALEISKRVFGERHPNTGEVRSLLLNFHLDVPDDTSYVVEEGYDGGQQASAVAAAPAPRTPTPPSAPKPSSGSPTRVAPTDPTQQDEEADIAGEGEEAPPAVVDDEVAAEVHPDVAPDEAVPASDDAVDPAVGEAVETAAEQATASPVVDGHEDGADEAAAIAATEETQPLVEAPPATEVDGVSDATAGNEEAAGEPAEEVAATDAVAPEPVAETVEADATETNELEVAAPDTADEAAPEAQEDVAPSESPEAQDPAALPDVGTEPEAEVTEAEAAEPDVTEAEGAEPDAAEAGVAHPEAAVEA